MRSFVCFLIVALTFQAHAEIYKWVDEDGRVHFGDTKPESIEKTETVTPDIAPIPDEPDEGEIRRLELVEQVLSAPPPPPKHTPTPASAQEAPHAQTSNISSCRSARTRYAILQQGVPVYWTESGILRAHWTGDAYRGERNYIADQERGGIEQNEIRDIYRYCPDPENEEALEQAHDDWVDAQWCEFHRVKLAKALEPNARTSKTHLNDIEEKIQEVCHN